MKEAKPIRVSGVGRVGMCKRSNVYNHWYGKEIEGHPIRLIVLVVVMLVLVLLPSSAAIGGQYVTPLNISQREQEFLTENSQIIHFDVDEDLILLEPYLNDTVVFLSGQWHFSRGSKEWELFLLKYLHRKAGVRILLVEAPYSIGYSLNDYVNGGKLRIDLEKPVLTRFFSQVRAFNLALPVAQRIRVVGIEAEFDHELSVNLLEELLLERRTEDFWRVIRGLK